MNKIKKYLLFLVLVVACCCCLTSCSCSFGKNRGGGNNSGGGDGSSGGEGGAPVTTYYEVVVDFNEPSCASYSSSTDSDVHLKGTSPVYTITPKDKWGIQYIKVNDIVVHSSEHDGYLYEPFVYEIDKINENITIEVELAQVHFAVTGEVVNDLYSSSDGATVVSDADGGICMGGTSAEFLIMPNSGYVLYKVILNGEEYYSYTPGDIRATENMIIEIEKVTKTTSLMVYAYKIEELSLLIENYHSGGLNKYGETSAYKLDGGTEFITYTIDGFDGFNIPSGYEGKILTTLSSNIKVVGFEYSNDGGVTWASYIDVQNQTDSNVYFDTSDKSFYVSAIHKLFKLRVYTSSDNMPLIIYNPNAGVGEQITTQAEIYLYSYYMISEAMATNYKWYYSKSTDYTESNTHKELSVTKTQHPVSGNDVYSIFISPDMCSEDGKIVIIFKPM